MYSKKIFFVQVVEEDYAEAAQKGEALIPENLYPNMHALTQMVKNKKYKGISSFEFGFDFILHGLEQMLVNKKNI